MATRRPRLSSDETRTRLIDVGIESLRQYGMSIGLDAVNLEEAVREAEVSRSSAYAVWSNGGYSPQEEFQRAVLLRAIDERRVTLEVLTKHVGELYQGLGEKMGPGQMLREIIRQTGAANVKATADSTGWKLVIALRAIMHSAPEQERDQELVKWMSESAEAMRDYTIENVYKPLAAIVGLVPRAQYGERAWELGYEATSAITEGFSMRYWIDSANYLDGLKHHAMEDGEANWGMYAMIFEKITEIFFVPSSGSWDDFE